MALARWSKDVVEGNREACKEAKVGIWWTKLMCIKTCRYLVLMLWKSTGKRAWKSHRRCRKMFGHSKIFLRRKKWSKREKAKPSNQQRTQWLPPRLWVQQQQSHHQSLRETRSYLARSPLEALSRIMVQRCSISMVSWVMMKSTLWCKLPQANLFALNN